MEKKNNKRKLSDGCLATATITETAQKHAEELWIDLNDEFKYKPSHIAAETTNSKYLDCKINVLPALRTQLHRYMNDERYDNSDGNGFKYHKNQLLKQLYETENDIDTSEVEKKDIEINTRAIVTMDACPVSGKMHELTTACIKMTELGGGKANSALEQLILFGNNTSDKSAESRELLDSYEAQFDYLQNIGLDVNFGDSIDMKQAQITRLEKNDLQMRKKRNLTKTMKQKKKSRSKMIDNNENDKQSGLDDIVNAAKGIGIIEELEKQLQSMDKDYNNAIVKIIVEFVADWIAEMGQTYTFGPNGELFLYKFVMVDNRESLADKYYKQLFASKTKAFMNDSDSNFNNNTNIYNNNNNNNNNANTIASINNNVNNNSSNNNCDEKETNLDDNNAVSELSSDSESESESKDESAVNEGNIRDVRNEYDGYSSDIDVKETEFDMKEEIITIMKKYDNDLFLIFFTRLNLYQWCELQKIYDFQIEQYLQNNDSLPQLFITNTKMHLLEPYFLVLDETWQNALENGIANDQEMKFRSFVAKYYLKCAVRKRFNKRWLGSINDNLHVTVSVLLGLILDISNCLHLNFDLDAIDNDPINIMTKHLDSFCSNLSKQVTKAAKKKNSKIKSLHGTGNQARSAVPAIPKSLSEADRVTTDTNDKYQIAYYLDVASNVLQCLELLLESSLDTEKESRIKDCLKKANHSLILCLYLSPYKTRPYVLRLLTVIMESLNMRYIEIGEAQSAGSTQSQELINKFLKRQFHDKNNNYKNYLLRCIQRLMFAMRTVVDLGLMSSGAQYKYYDNKIIKIWNDDIKSEFASLNYSKQTIDIKRKLEKIEKRSDITPQLFELKKNSCKKRKEKQMKRKLSKQRSNNSNSNSVAESKHGRRRRRRGIGVVKGDESNQLSVNVEASARGSIGMAPLGRRRGKIIQKPSSRRY